MCLLHRPYALTFHKVEYVALHYRFLHRQVDLHLPIFNNNLTRQHIAGLCLLGWSYLFFVTLNVLTVKDIMNHYL
jgi:hypothetical protein